MRPGASAFNSHVLKPHERCSLEPMNEEFSTAQEATHILREWAGEQIRRLSSRGGRAYGRELGSVACEWQSTGLGCPQTVGEFNEPVEPAIVPQHYELVILLPPTARALAERLANELRDAMASDETLGDRVEATEIPTGASSLEDGENEDFEGSVRVRVPVTVYVW
jgi:hypothetical protein